MDIDTYQNDWLELLRMERQIVKDVKIHLNKMIGKCYDDFNILEEAVANVVYAVCETVDLYYEETYDVVRDIDINYFHGIFQSYSLKKILLHKN